MLNIYRYPKNNSVNNYDKNNHENSYRCMTYHQSSEKTVDFHYYIQEKYLDHLGLINDLQTCLEKDDLNICYQPLIDLETGQPTSVEALIRWQHKLAGSISPEIFIPLAEQTGHIHALTFWVLNRTLQQLHVWKSDNIDIDVAVNLSMFNLHDEGFPSQVCRLLDKWSISPEQLILEITEGVIMYNPEQAIRILENLNDIGVRLALDDFGAGYSSLGHLSRLPISELKIDRSLIMDIDKNHKNAMIVRSTIELAQELGLKIVAEGVENATVCDILREYGCNCVQGFFFSKPVNDVEFKSWFMNNCRTDCSQPVYFKPEPVWI